MKVCLLRLTVCLAFCSAMVGSTLSGQTAPANRTTRIYVEPFTTQEGSERFRADVVAELRKLSSVLPASDESSADAILGGGGEVWIKGYRSHNPQLGRVAPNGTPIYTGFLSIELRDTNGETLWSYLATPPAASRDVSKDLSAQIVKNWPNTLNKAKPIPNHFPTQPTTILKGAGATFPYPVYKK